MKSIIFFVLIFSQNICSMGWFSNKKCCDGNDGSNRIGWNNTQEDILSIPACSNPTSNVCKQIVSEINEFKKAFENVYFFSSNDVCSGKNTNNFLSQPFFREISDDFFKENKTILPSEKKSEFRTKFDPFMGCARAKAPNEYIKSYLKYCFEAKENNLSFKDYLKNIIFRK